MTGASGPPRGVHALAGEALAIGDLDLKVAATRALADAWAAGVLCRDLDAPVLPVDAVGRPPRPVLVAPRDLPARKLGRPDGRIAAVHAVTHIEANAVNLALDAVHRFRDVPDEFVGDWLGVAADESRHFLALRARLRALGAEYGDLPAHDGLWAAAVRTATDPLARMALVPRVLEARGLDVTPGMIERFDAAGDPETAAELRVILAEEVGHVAVGSRWFRWHCAARDLDPEPTFRALLADAGVAVVPPLNRSARLAAGFGEAELDALVASGPN